MTPVPRSEACSNPLVLGVILEITLESCKSGCVLPFRLWLLHFLKYKGCGCDNATIEVQRLNFEVRLYRLFLSYSE